MDWTPTEMMGAVTELGGQILTDDPAGWAALAEADLLALDDLLDQVALMIEVGRAGARVPALETMFLGWPLWQAGQAPQPGEVLTGALTEEGGQDPLHSTVRTLDGRLTGVKTCVPSAREASRIVVAAADGVWVIDPADATLEEQVGTNGDPLARLVLDSTPGERLGGLALTQAWMDRVHVGVSALQLGLSRTAIDLTASYVRERQQFGRPIGTFQAVSQRAADAWIDLQALEVVVWQAAWRLSEGLEASRQIHIARWWAAEASHRILAAAQHLHGGFGFDRDYPLHRYFLTAKQWEFLLGGAGAQLDALGDVVARHGGVGATPVPPRSSS